jgi:response regulator RpfG family c-di-GMP phosphodiesterase
MVKSKKNMFNSDKLKTIKEKEKTTKRHTLMVVNDEEKIRKSMVSLLGNKYEVIVKTDGQEALDYILSIEGREKISLIISDYKMPHLTGIELFMKVKTIIPNTLRILLTAHNEPHIRADAIKRAEVFEFIEKPFDPASLILRVQRAIEYSENQKYN